MYMRVVNVPTWLCVVPSKVSKRRRQHGEVICVIEAVFATVDSRIVTVSPPIHSKRRRQMQCE
jgi:hypothetical protein